MKNKKYILIILIVAIAILLIWANIEFRVVKNNSISINQKIRQRFEEASFIIDSPGVLREKGKDENYALSLLNQNLQENPNDSLSKLYVGKLIELHGFKSGVEFEKESVEKALVLYEEVLAKEPKLKLAHLRKNLSLFRLNPIKPQNAMEYYEQVIKKFNINEMNDLELRALVSLQRNLNLYNDFMTTVSNLLNKKLSNEMQINLNFELGSFYSNHSDHNSQMRCIDNYKKVIQLQPKNYWAYINILICLNNVSDFNTAINYGTEGLKLIDHGMIKNNLADSYAKRAIEALRFNQIEAASNDLVKAKELAFEDSFVVNLAYVFMHLKKSQIQEATLVLKSMHEKSPLAYNKMFQIIPRLMTESDFPNYRDLYLSFSDALTVQIDKVDVRHFALNNLGFLYEKEIRKYYKEDVIELVKKLESSENDLTIKKTLIKKLAECYLFYANATRNEAYIEKINQLKLRLTEMDSNSDYIKQIDDLETMLKSSMKYNKENYLREVERIKNDLVLKNDPEHLKRFEVINDPEK